jgi:transcriptional regulator with XRE-family HTH domain
MDGLKIKMVRDLRGYSQDYVASKLGISQNTYSGYETNQTNISVKTLEKIAEILEVPASDLMTTSGIAHFEINNGTVFGNIETVILSQKELYEQMLTSKDEEIARLTKLVDRLMDKK